MRGLSSAMTLALVSSSGSPPTIELGQPKLDESGKDRMAALCIETADGSGPDLLAEKQLDQR